MEDKGKESNEFMYAANEPNAFTNNDRVKNHTSERRNGNVISNIHCDSIYDKESKFIRNLKKMQQGKKKSGGKQKTFTIQSIKQLEKQMKEPERSGGFYTLPGGIAGVYILKNMIKHLDLKSTLNLKETSLIKHLSLKYDNNVIHNSIDELVKVGKERVSNKLHEKYRKEFPTATANCCSWQGIPAPFLLACEKGRINDVMKFIHLHNCNAYKWKENYQVPDRICVNGSLSQMYYPKQMNVNTAGRLNDMVNKEGTTSTGFPATPLCIAAINEHLPVCKLLLKHGADIGHTTTFGLNCLHLAATHNNKSTETIKFLLSNMSLKEINALSGLSRDTTPLDMAYRDPEQNPIGFDIIKLIRKYGGKADHHNEKGLMVGYGNGDLYD